MVDEIQLIERLNGLRAILKTQPDLADMIVLGMIDEAEQKVARFEAAHEQEDLFDNVPV